MAVDLPTFQQLYEAWWAEVQARDPRLTDTNAGSALDAVGGGSSVLADEVIRIAVELFADQFFDTATGDALDALAQDRFGGNITRKPAVAAVGELALLRGDYVGSIEYPAGTRARANVDGQEVVVATDYTVTLLEGEFQVLVPATAAVAGRDGNVDFGTVTELIDIPAEDPKASVINDYRFAGGRDAETDDQFRDRIRRFYNTVRRATVDALVQGAQTVGGVQFATVDETFIAPDDGGYVLLVVGDVDGSANDTLTALVEAEIENWRAAGVWVVVQAAEREEIAMSVRLTLRKNADQQTIQEDARAAILAYTDNLEPGEILRESNVICAALDVSEDVIDAVMTTPSGDQSPTLPYNALRVKDSDLTILVT